MHKDIYLLFLKSLYKTYPNTYVDVSDFFIKNKLPLDLERGDYIGTDIYLNKILGLLSHMKEIGHIDYKDYSVKSEGINEKDWANRLKIDAKITMVGREYYKTHKTKYIEITVMWATILTVIATCLGVVIAYFALPNKQPLIPLKKPEVHTKEQSTSKTIPKDTN